MDRLSRSQFLTVVGVVAFLAASAGVLLTESQLKRENAAGLTGPFSALRELPQAGSEPIVKAVAETSKAVVSIVASKDVPVIEQYELSPFGDDPFLQQFFGDRFTIPQLRERGTERRDISSGSGFIVSPDGYIVTNKHVVADPSADYTVFLNTGEKMNAKVVALDPLEDLAIIKVEKKGLPTVRLGDSNEIQIGQTAIAIGNSLGEFSNTVSVGVISGLQRSITAFGRGIGSEELSELIQTDAAINVGNSGGPLLNIRGEVIGINTAIVQGAENIGFSIPINKAKRALESVRRSGKIIYPYLGVRYVMVTSDIQVSNKLPVAEGAWLRAAENESAVMPGSPADAAGLRGNDIIVKINDEEVTRERNLASLLSRYAVGDTIAVTYVRNGETKTVQVRLTLRP